MLNLIQLIAENLFSTIISNSEDVIGTFKKVEIVFELGTLIEFLKFV